MDSVARTPCARVTTSTRPMSGIAALREALADKVETLYGVRYDSGQRSNRDRERQRRAFIRRSARLVHPGDEVIYFEPSFDSYGPIVRLQGATPVAIKLSLADFRMNWDEVAAAITPKTRMIIINTPHNPTATRVQRGRHRAPEGAHAQHRHRDSRRRGLRACRVRRRQTSKHGVPYRTRGA